MPLLVLQIIFCKHLIDDKKRLPYFIFTLIFIASVFLSLPELTHHQAKEQVLNKYEMNIVETDTVPIEDEWNPYIADRAYFFKGNNSKLEELSIIVSANTGEMFVVDDPL